LPDGIRALGREQPRIVGYAAKWNETAAEYRTRCACSAGIGEPQLQTNLERLARTPALFGPTGYARVDFGWIARPALYSEVNPIRASNPMPDWQRQ
jgi:hypothetical protein